MYCAMVAWARGFIYIYIYIYIFFFFWRWRKLWGTGSNPAGATFGILFLFVCFIVFLRFGLFLFILIATLLRGFCDDVYLVYSITMKTNQLLLKKYIAHDVCNAERKSYTVIYVTEELSNSTGLKKNS